jgi:hypothetical protein
MTSADPLLLAVDLGVRTGLATYDQEGRLVWYRSKNFGSAAALRRGIHSVLGELPHLEHLVLEGGGNLADIWLAQTDRHGVQVQQIAADTWRREIYYPREHRNSVIAKQTADVLARRVIEWSNAPRPTSLRHDAAEAILIGLWGVIKLGWLPQLPSEVRN